ncbi:MAG TPA: gamma-glutamyltransferase [Acetobacteraceae bacterium]|jgi:gamma-glutamyltranspeptidase/glutathione hydrolase|nr:gamma-glutamyltransferase [Acetobacteraceae bacterium]
MQYVPPPHVVQHWQLTKPSATGRSGVVVSQARDAAEAGVAVLREGGNAVDAAVATAFALAAVEPWNTGLGGIGFAVIHRAGERKAQVVDFGPVSPRGIDPSAFKLTGRMMEDLFAWPEVEGDANVHGPLSVAVPSAVAGYEAMHKRWGRMPMKDILAPAVALAERGLAADWWTTLKIASCAAILRRYPESARIYLPDGLPRCAADSTRQDFFRLGNLPATLARLRDVGLRDFYEGEIAASIAADAAAMGGVLSAADLRACAARIVPATEAAWRNGRTLQLASGLTAAPTLLRVLDAMRSVPVGATPDAAWYASLAQALKDAYAERLLGLGDTGAIAAETCTTHLTTCDAEGTMVALTSTLLSTMGSRVVLPTSGVLMNNGVMWFDPRPGQANSIGPGKRPLTNMCPIVMAEGGRPVLAGGASGGRKIMGAVFQLMSFVSDFGMDPQTAGHHPRIDVSGTERVTVDQRLPEDVQSALAEVADVELIEHKTFPGGFANPNAIVRNPDGTQTGMSDAMSPWAAAVAA